MTKKNILELLKNSMLEGRKEPFVKYLDILMTTASEKKVYESLAQIFSDNYTRYNADFLAVFLEISFRRNPRLVTLNHPLNDFFAIIVINGSIDLYDCYIEVGIEPHAANMNEDEKKIFYKELLNVAAELNESIFGDYTESVKGRDYNGKFGMDETYENAVLINSEDYEAMEKVVAKYNMIIGRRNIIKDLINRAGMELRNG